jgi:HK97 family phage portal protein
MSRLLDALDAFSCMKAAGHPLSTSLKASSMVFSSGGFGGLTSGNNYWPRTFRRLEDPWPMRAGYDSKGYDVNGILSNSIAGSCMGWILRNFPEARCMAFDGEGDDAEKLPDHPFSLLMEEPNPEYTREELWQCLLMDWWITGQGNAYLKKERNNMGDVIAIWHIPANEIEPHWPKGVSVSGPKGYVDYYERTIDGKIEKEERRDIIHLRFGRDPNNQRKGWTPISSGGSEIGNFNEGSAYRRDILANHGVPSYGAIPKDENVARQMTPEKSDLIQKVFQAKFTGRQRGANLWIPNFAATLERLGYSPEELDIRNTMAWDADIICSLFGLNSMILGLPSGEGHRTYSNQEDARKGAYRENVIPTHMLMAPILKRELMNEYTSHSYYRKSGVSVQSVKVGWDYSRVGVLQPDQNELRKSLDGSVERGIYAPNEARRRLNLTPITKEEYDKIMRGEISVFDIPQVISRLGPIPWREPSDFPAPGNERQITGPLENPERQAASSGNGKVPTG